jgi:hypothetical protein
MMIMMMMTMIWENVYIHTVFQAGDRDETERISFSVICLFMQRILIFRGFNGKKRGTE